MDHADRRGPAAQSRAIRDVLRGMVAAGVTDPSLLDDVMAGVIAVGNPSRHQLALFT
ncbi:MAG: hypothetical protein P8Z68_08235 [Kineosporiaceae bacterium]